MKRKTDEDHRRLGTYRPDRHRPKDRRPATDLPRCPQWLSAAAKLEWQSIAGDLHAAGMLDTLNVRELGIYCQSWATLRACWEELEANGWVQTSASGYESPRPWVTIARMCEKQVVSLADQFGLLPNARQRLGIRTAGITQHCSELEAFLRGDD